jgi:hypothetical protein
MEMIGVVVEADGESVGVVDAAAANDPKVGEGTPQTAPEHDLAAELPLTVRHPVRMAGLAQAVAGAGGALALGAPRRVVVPLAAGLYLASELAARRVTPLACPRDRQGDPLTP